MASTTNVMITQTTFLNLKDKQIQETIKRLEILQNKYKLHPNVLQELKTDKTIYFR